MYDTCIQKLVQLTWNTRNIRLFFVLLIACECHCFSVLMYRSVIGRDLMAKTNVKRLIGEIDDHLRQEGKHLDSSVNVSM